MSDYADRIAERISDRVCLPNGHKALEELLAKAAREGYAMGWAAKP